MNEKSQVGLASPRANPRAGRRFAFILSAALLCISVVLLCARSPGGSAWQLSIHPTNWWVSRTASERVLGFRSPAAYKRICVSYNIGPIVVSRFVEEAFPQPLGTNTLQVGDCLYDPTSKREIWTVLAVEKLHEFDDGTDRDGVLVCSTGNGGESWLPREKLGKVLVGR